VLANRAQESIRRAPSVTEAVYEAGYSASSRFYDGAGRELGMAPRTVRAGADGERVRYVTRPCSLGRIIVAWTDRGACDVQFGETDEALVARIRRRFPRASLERDGAPGWVDDVIEAVDMPRPLDIPLDIEGTAFQQRVWQALREIPAGRTASYAEIARRIGAPKSVRAVAQACASNTIAVAIPCHRVVRNDGALSGYRWGVERKSALLRREAAA
jgi:AraC family transcriptional regulator of adaptative response/methylated-DNA-[protein]-cysteine methyltransferase